MPFKIPSPSEGAPISGNPYLGEGTHEVVVDEVEEGTSSGGHPQLQVTFKNDAGQTIRDWLYPTRAAFRVQGLWEAAGLAWPEEGGEIDESDLLGRRLLIVVAPDTYQGVTRDKVKDYQPVVGSDISFTPSFGGPAVPAVAGDDETIPFRWDEPRDYDQRYHAQRSL